MKKNLYKLFSFAVLATLIISCGSESNPLIKKAKEGIEAQNYEAAIASLDQAIDQDSSDADAYYFKGLAYGEIAEANPVVSERKETYRMMRENLLMADEWYTKKEINSVESLEATLIITRKWATEHNAGIQLASQDPSLSTVDEPLEISEDHFENAIVINPDSLISFEVLADIYRINQKPEKSIETFKQVISRSTEPDAYLYDRLGGLYLQTENYEMAKEVLDEGINVFPDSVFLVQKLADTFMKLGENQESIKVIESLIERDPNNAQYHLVLGTQIYIVASQIDDEVSAEYDEIFDLERQLREAKAAEKRTIETKISESRKEIETKSKSSNALTAQAIEELKLVTELRPDDALTYNSLGIIFQNKAAALFEKRNATVDNDAAAKIAAEANDNLREAMNYYEKATELEPDNQDFWRSLFQVYTQLGMNDKAEAAMKKAGM